MKGIYYLLVLVTLVACNENSTVREASTSESVTTPVDTLSEKSSETLQHLKSVEDIQQEFSYVTAKVESTSMDSTSISYNCNNEKQGTLTYFSENGQLRMIKHTYSEYSHFSATDRYYVKNDSLFFVFYDRLAWSFAGQNVTRDNITESRFYIVDNKPVECLEKKFTVLSDAKDAPQSNQVASEVIECPAFAPIAEKFELLLKYKDRQEDLQCLEE